MIATNKNKIDSQSDVRDHTKTAIKGDHKAHHQYKADDHRIQATLDILSTKTWTDGALFNKIDWCCQRTSSQQQGELRRLSRELSRPVIRN